MELSGPDPSERRTSGGSFHRRNGAWSKGPMAGLAAPKRAPHVHNLPSFASIRVVPDLGAKAQGSKLKGKRCGEGTAVTFVPRPSCPL